MAPKQLTIKCHFGMLFTKVIKMTLKQRRIDKGLTQAQCAGYLQIPLRTYKRYESKEEKIDPIKYQYIVTRLNEYGLIDEEHGTLTISQIRSECSNIFEQYNVEYAYLFGSYAKGKETERSDVDILVSVEVDGLRFFELAELLREKLRKKVDLLNAEQLEKNPALVREIMRDGIKIYG